MGGTNTRKSLFQRDLSGRVHAWSEASACVTPSRPAKSNGDQHDTVILEYVPVQWNLEQQRLRSRASRATNSWGRFLLYWAATKRARQIAQKAVGRSAMIGGPVLAVAATAAALSIMLTAASPEATILVISGVPLSASITAGLSVAAAAVVFALLCVATYAVEHARQYRSSNAGSRRQMLRQQSDGVQMKLFHSSVASGRRHPVAVLPPALTAQPM